MEDECHELDLEIVEEEESRLRGGSSYSHFVEDLNPLTVGLFSTQTLIINKNHFCSYSTHTLTNRYQLGAHILKNKMVVVWLS